MSARLAVVCAIRNEGPFIAEWIAWQRMLGFTDILMVTNDCTDHAPQLLDCFVRAGWITHITHQPKPGKPPKRTAHRAALAHPVVQNADWMLLCDIDEFLVIHEGDGTVPGFLDGMDLHCRCLAVHWRIFGTSGQATWEDGLTHRRFTRAGPKPNATESSFKTLVNRPRDFARLAAHSPCEFSGTWGKPPNVMLDTNGRVLPYYDPDKNPQRATAANWIAHGSAQLNHYITREVEHFEAKRGTPCASRNFDRYTDGFFATYDRNEEDDRSALNYRDRFDAVHAQAMALPGVAHFHHLCCADHVAWLCERSGHDPAQDPRRAHHLGRTADFAAA